MRRGNFPRLIIYQGINMRVLAGLAIVVGITSGAAWQTPAMAQSAPRPCVNESLQINIRAQPMPAALRELSRQTHCPISGTADARGLTSNAVRGTYTPSAALAALVDRRGLRTRSVRQGLSVERLARTRPAPTPEPIQFDCQNDSIALRIPSMPLEAALNALSEATKCPISRSFQVDGLRSRAINDTYTPSEGLRAMLAGTGLQSQAIRQGLEVLPAR